LCHYKPCHCTPVFFATGQVWVSRSLFTVTCFVWFRARLCLYKPCHYMFISVFQDTIVSLKAMLRYSRLLCFKTRLCLYKPFHCTSVYCASGNECISTSLDNVCQFTICFKTRLYLYSAQALSLYACFLVFHATIVSQKALSLCTCLLLFRTRVCLYTPCHCTPVHDMFQDTSVSI